MTQPVDFAWVRRELRDQTARLIEECYQSEPFAGYLRDLLSIPGGLLTGHGGSGMVDVILGVFTALRPEQDWRDVMPALVSVELAHTAWELLDKIIDDEKPDGVESWDLVQLSNAVMTLNTLTVYPLLELSSKGFPQRRIDRCMRGIASMCVTVAGTNHLDVLAERNPEPTLDLALQLTVGKSAPVDQVIGPVGAGLATDDEGLVQHMTEFGRAVAVYQALCNDLNDVLPGDTRKSDVRKRKKTFPIVFLMTQVPEAKFKEEKGLLRETRPMTNQEEEKVRQALVDSGAVDFTSVMAEKYRLQAVRLARSLGGQVDTQELMRVSGVTAV